MDNLFWRNSSGHLLLVNPSEYDDYRQILAYDNECHVCRQDVMVALGFYNYHD
jgi:hypothetical protein